MNDHPSFEHWEANELVKYAHEAFDMILAQQDTIQQLRLDIKKLMTQLDKDDWK